MIRLAREKNLLTTPYVFNADEAEQMVDAGADVIVAHMGLTTKGTIGAHTARTLDDCVRDVQAIADAARGVRSDVIILCHGGPIAMPDDAEYVLSRTQRTCTASTAHHPWSGCPSKPRSPNKSENSKPSASEFSLAIWERAGVRVPCREPLLAA